MPSQHPLPIASPPPSPGSNHDDNEEEVNYHDALNDLAKKWLNIQLNHNFSIAAADSFWKLSMASVSHLLASKENSNVRKGVPGFIHLKRKMYEDQCPKVYMKFVYRNKNTGEIEIHKGDKCPRSQFPKSQYIKLYEEAHIKVNHIIY